MVTSPYILIAGPSASGKSTLAAQTAAELQLPCLSLDSYFLREPQLFVETPNGKIRTYERPELYNGRQLALDILAQPEGAVVEGFCLFTFPEIFRLSPNRYYLDVPFQICVARRSARTPQRRSDTSFAIIGETESARYTLPQRNLPGVQTLDGTKPTAELLQVIVEQYQQAKLATGDNTPPYGH